MEKAKITVRSVMDGIEKVSEFQGEVDFKDNPLIIYDDNGVLTSTEIYEKFTTVKRKSGDIENLFVYNADEKFVGKYKSEYGDLPLEITTLSYKIVKTHNSIALFIKFLSTFSENSSSLSIGVQLKK